MLRQRVLSALVFGPIVFLCFYLGGVWFYSFLGLLAFAGAIEYRAMMKTKDVEVHPVFCVLAAVTAVSSAGRPWLIVAALVASAMILLVLGLWHLRLASALAGLAGLVYLGAFSSLLGLLRATPDGREWGLMVLFCTWATDVVAYFVGSWFGSRRIAPSVSPSKTLEGAVSGAVASCLTAYFLAGPFHLRPGFSLMAGLMLGIAAEAGDLVESGLKRFAGVKDSGTVLPGHGGVLDRFDSLLFTGPTGLFLAILYRILGGGIGAS